MTPQRHLVLGGSHGIGYAFAQRAATRGTALHLVARNERDLRAAARRLTRLGARSVQVVAGDLLDEAFRADLWHGFERFRFSTIVASGPSPPSGRYSTATPDRMRVANEIVLVYPAWVLAFALAGRLRADGALVLVGSSVVASSVFETPFALSCLYRTALEKLVEDHRAVFASARKRLYLWRPEVVFTRLARQRARTLAPGASSAVQRAALRRELGHNVLTPLQYVERECGNSSL